LLTGQWPHRLEEGANLWGYLPVRFACYPEILEQRGYHVGFTGKGWGPGDFRAGGRKRNPAGNLYKDFATFLQKRPKDRPFCFWFGSIDPHRPYETGAGARAGLDAKHVRVPRFLPDLPTVRQDFLDYYFEVQRFDRDVGKLLAELERVGLGENTLVIVTSDNGMPFPRAKANLYDAGTRVPLAVRWPSRIRSGQVVEALVSHVDLAPTILQAACITPQNMDGESLLPHLSGNPVRQREYIFTERERHANVRAGNAGFPARAVRSRDWLYIRNFRPDRWPAGDPRHWYAVGPFGDIDTGPTKEAVLKTEGMPDLGRFFALACGKRPPEELYDLKNDPDQIENLAGRSNYAAKLSELRKVLHDWMKQTGDPRLDDGDDRFDKMPYFGPPTKEQ